MSACAGCGLARPAFALDDEGRCSACAMDAARASVQAAEAAAARDAETIRARMIARIKARAGVEISRRLPAWKQANMTARRIELFALGVPKQEAAPPAEAGAEAHEAWRIDRAWDWVRAVREHSDALEAAVIASEDPAAIALSGWPAWQTEENP